MNLRAPKDKAEARVDEVEPEDEPDCVVCPFLVGWRFSWRAFASAFSWVRTKLARFYQSLIVSRPNRRQWYAVADSELDELVPEMLTLMKSCPSVVSSFSITVKKNLYIASQDTGRVR